MAADNGSTDLVYTYLVARDDQPKLADRVGVKELLDEALHLGEGGTVILHYNLLAPIEIPIQILRDEPEQQHRTRLAPPSARKR